MKKRMGLILLNICMLLVLLPTAALAEETADTVWKVSTDDQGSQCYASAHSWEDLEKALKTVPEVTNMNQSELTIWVSDFTWPESTDGEMIDLVLDYPLTSQKSDTPNQMPRIYLYGKADDSGFTTWEIPEYINLTCYEDMEKDYYSAPVRIVVNGTLNLASEIEDYYKKSEIVVNGTLNCMPDAGGWSGADLRTISSVTVNEGGTFAAEYTEFAQEVILDRGASMKMGQTNYVFDLTVHSGAIFTPTSESAWYLFGTLTLDGGVELDAGSMSLWTNSGAHSGSVDAAIVTDGAAAVTGTIGMKVYQSAATLTLQGDLTVEMLSVNTSDPGTAKIIIPADSHAKISYINAGNAQNGLNMQVIGTLEFGVSGGCSKWKTGELVLGETAEDGTVTKGTVILRPSSHLFAAYLNKDGTVNEQVTGKITGNGTIKMYARICLDYYGGWGWYPGLFGYNCEEDETAPLYAQGYIADTVTIWRNWDENDLNCSHKWSDDGVIEIGPTCTRPGEKVYTCTDCGTEKVETIAATGHTEVTDAAVAPTCTGTGLTAGSHCSACGKTLSGRETVAALGHDWDPKNCAEAASCTRCSATREAGAHHYDLSGMCTVCGDTNSPVSFDTDTAAVTLSSMPEGAAKAWIAAYRNGQLLDIVAGQAGSNQMSDAARQADEIRVFYPGEDHSPVSGAHRLYA